MVTTTTPNPDPDDRRRAKLELSSRYGKYPDAVPLAEEPAEHRLEPEPAGDPAVTLVTFTDDEVSLVCLALTEFAMLRFVKYKNMSDFANEIATRLLNARDEQHR